MTAKNLLLPLTLIGANFFAVNANAIIIEGTFTGSVNSSANCTNTRLKNCTALWSDDLAGTQASGSFWYDTDLAPKDASPRENFGQYFTYTNSWLNMYINIGGLSFDISEALGPNHDMLDIEHISISDLHSIVPDGYERQSITLNDSSSSGSASGDYLTKRLTMNVATWDKPIVNGTSLIQDYQWQDNGNLLQGTANFIFEKKWGDQTQYGTARILLTDFTINKKHQTVPEPSSFILLLLGTLALSARVIHSAPAKKTTARIAAKIN